MFLFDKIVRDAKFGLGEPVNDRKSLFKGQEKDYRRLEASCDNLFVAIQLELSKDSGSLQA